MQIISLFLSALFLLFALPANAESPPRPADEMAMIAAVISARDQYNSGVNDMAKGAARFARKQALCNLMKSGEVSNWIGKATSLTTNSDGKGVISVEIAEGISVKTWNNDLSDIQDNTMLTPTSDVFQQAMKLQEGETVNFSGHFAMSDSDCFEEASMTLEGSMTEPEFIFHFTEIGVADVQSAAPPPAQASPEPTVVTPVPAPASVAATPPARPQPTGVTFPHLPPSPEIPAATASATPPVAPLPGPVTMYDKGLADRTAWENWFNGLLGDFKTGAFFWAGQRSLPHPGSCSQMNTDFYNGCMAAKERLATTDALRMSEPDYKQGWNAYVAPGASYYQGTSVTAPPALLPASSANPQFDQFPVNEIYRGPPMMPDFAKRDRQFQDFRTRLRSGIKEGTNFAGHYKIMQIGCGTECTFSYLTDVSTGQVFAGVPLGGEDYPEVQLEYRTSSKLIRTWWNPHPFEGNNCSQEDFALENNKFVSLRDSVLAACPRDCDDNGSCINSGGMPQDHNVVAAIPLHAGSAEAPATAPPALASAPTAAEVPVASVLSAPTNPNWEKIGREGNSAMVDYVDMADIKRTNLRATIWVMQNNEFQGDPSLLPNFRSVVFEAEYDCNAQLTRGSYYAIFSRHMGRGVILDGGPLPADDRLTEWRPIPADQEREAEIACEQHSEVTPQLSGSNLPNPVPSTLKCFTVYPAVSPADCFAH